LADLLFYRGQVLAGRELAEDIAAHWRRHTDAMIAGGIESTLAVRALYGLSMLCFASALRVEDPTATGSPDRSRKTICRRTAAGYIRGM
jgi:hypothetical protein